MPIGISIFSTIHVLLCVYLTLGVGAATKIARINDIPQERLPRIATFVNEYYALLWVPPLLWAFFALHRYYRSGIDAHETTRMFISGFSISLILFLFCFLASTATLSMKAGSLQAFP